MKLIDYIKKLEEIAPKKDAEEWDNTGLQIGNIQDEINGILLTLDISEEAINLAIQEGLNLIITHHPFIFKAIKNIDFTYSKAKLIKKIINNNINVFTMHTNLDIASKGVNSALAKAIGINNYDILKTVNTLDEEVLGYGGISEINECSIYEYSEKIKQHLGCPYIKIFCKDNKKSIKKVAFCGGSGSSFISDAIKKHADLYITGDINYHDAQYAQEFNLAIIDAGHYYTELPVLKEINRHLRDIDEKIKIELFSENTVKEIII